MSLIQLVDFKSLGDGRGELLALEAHKNIPFDIKRVYYLYGTKTDVARGFHAHKELKQVAIAVSGSCRFKLDDGFTSDYVVLDDPSKGLLIDSCLWREMDEFSEDCVLLVIASEQYDESDYIRDYDEFLALRNDK